MFIARKQSLLLQQLLAILFLARSLQIIKRNERVNIYHIVCSDNFCFVNCNINLQMVQINQEYVK